MVKPTKPVKSPKPAADSDDYFTLEDGVIDAGDELDDPDGEYFTLPEDADEDAEDGEEEE